MISQLVRATASALLCYVQVHWMSLMPGPSSTGGGRHSSGRRRIFRRIWVHKRGLPVSVVGASVLGKQCRKPFGQPTIGYLLQSIQCTHCTAQLSGRANCSFIDLSACLAAGRTLPAVPRICPMGMMHTRTWAKWAGVTRSAHAIGRCLSTGGPTNSEVEEPVQV